MSETTVSTSTFKRERPLSTAVPRMPLPGSQLTYTILAKQSFPQAQPPRPSMTTTTTTTTTTATATSNLYQAQSLKKTISIEATNGTVHGGPKSLHNGSGGPAPVPKKVAYNYPVVPLRGPTGYGTLTNGEPSVAQPPLGRSPLAPRPGTEAPRPIAQKLTMGYHPNLAPKGTIPKVPTPLARAVNGGLPPQGVTAGASPLPALVPSSLYPLTPISLGTSPIPIECKTSPTKHPLPAAPPSDKELKETLCIKIKENEKLRKLIDNMKQEIGKLKATLRVHCTTYPASLNPQSLKPHRTQSIFGQLIDHSYGLPTGLSPGLAALTGSGDELAEEYLTLIGENETLPPPSFGHMDIPLLSPSAWLNPEFRPSAKRCKAAASEASVSSRSHGGLTQAGGAGPIKPPSFTNTTWEYLPDRELFSPCQFCGVEMPCLCLKADLEMEDLLCSGVGGKLLGILVKDMAQSREDGNP